MIALEGRIVSANASSMYTTGSAKRLVVFLLNIRLRSRLILFTLLLIVTEPWIDRYSASGHGRRTSPKIHRFSRKHLVLLHDIDFSTTCTF
jgi:hypothetical protein